MQPNWDSRINVPTISLTENKFAFQFFIFNLAIQSPILDDNFRRSAIIIERPNLNKDL